MEPTFESILSFPPGTLCTLLRDAYAFEPGFERDFLSQWEDFDRFSMTIPPSPKAAAS